MLRKRNIKWKKHNYLKVFSIYLPINPFGALHSFMQIWASICYFPSAWRMIFIHFFEVHLLETVSGYVCLQMYLLIFLLMDIFIGCKSFFFFSPPPLDINLIFYFFSFSIIFLPLLFLLEISCNSYCCSVWIYVCILYVLQCVCVF